MYDKLAGECAYIENQAGHYFTDINDRDLSSYKKTPQKIICQRSGENEMQTGLMK